MSSKPVEVKPVLPTDPTIRKESPIITGVLDYFPLAIAEVARISKAGNDQHNLGQALHWERGKSQDHADCIGRHLADRGLRDTDGQRHSGKLAWRALALLETELEEAGGNMGRASWVEDEPATFIMPPVLCLAEHSTGLLCELERGHLGYHVALGGLSTEVDWR